MNKYLSHAYILKRTKSIKELYTQEHKKNKGKPTKEKVMIKHRTRLNGLTLKKQSPLESPTVATYPSAGGRRVTRGSVFQERNTHGVATNVYLRKTSKKTGKDVIYELKVKDSGVVFTHREGISTPHIRHKRRQPLIKCANMTSIFMFLFTSLFLFVLFIFFIFLRLMRVFPLLLRIP